MISHQELQNLVAVGLVKRHRTSGAYALSKRGLLFVSNLFSDSVPTLSPSYHKEAIIRRLRISALTVTAYRAGVHLFTTTPAELARSPSLFLSAITRSRGSNPWGSTRVAALAHLGDLICAVHFVCPGIGKVSLTDELTAFGNQVSSFRSLRRCVIFAGESYQEILAELTSPQSEKDTKLVSYALAYRALHLPVYLVSCDDIGALQLRLMAVPDYRRRLTMAALKAQYEPPPEEIPSLDAFFHGMPFVMAADMDLRRVDAALKIAQERGCSQIAIAALERQASSILFSQYRETGKARIFILTSSALSEVLGGAPTLHTPSRMQFLTEKGEVVDVPPIQPEKKASSPH